MNCVVPDLSVGWWWWLVRGWVWALLTSVHPEASLAKLLFVREGLHHHTASFFDEKGKTWTIVAFHCLTPFFLEGFSLSSPAWLFFDGGREGGESLWGRVFDG